MSANENRLTAFQAGLTIRSTIQTTIGNDLTNYQATMSSPNGTGYFATHGGTATELIIADV